MNTIGRIACTEMRYKGVVSVNATPIDTKKYQVDLKSNLYGLECDGTERNIKDCRVANNAASDQTFFELSVDCYGQFLNVF